jgi:hypothetical protein
MKGAKRLFFAKPGQGMVAVKTGFSWQAFLFGSLWAAAKRMWVPYFFIMTVLDIALWFVTGYAEGQRNGGLALAGLAGMLVYAIVRGKFAHRWHAASLRSRGFIQQGAAEGAA